MATVNLNSIKEWFKTAKKPTQQQFWDTWDSFWHKLEKISISAIDGLQTILNKKVDIEQFDGHLNDKNNPHQVTAEQLGAATSDDLQTHVDDKNNPHNVTIEQLGGVTTEQLDNEINNRTNADKYLQEQIDGLNSDVNWDDINNIPTIINNIAANEHDDTVKVIFNDKLVDAFNIITEEKKVVLMYDKPLGLNQYVQIEGNFEEYQPDVTEIGAMMKFRGIDE